MAPPSELSAGDDATPHHDSPKPDAALHQPALLHEVIRFLSPRPGETIVDCTVGSAGHSLAIAPRLLPDGHLIAIDRDEQALAIARRRLAEFAPHVTFVHEDFRNLPAILAAPHRQRVDGVLADLGMSSVQVDDPDRGFSFLKAGPLDMRMDQRQERTAAWLVNRLSAEELADLLTRFGEERWAKRIARRIVERRKHTPITTTEALARIVSEAIPPRAYPGRIHPATRTFQALRLVVNEELTALETLLEALPALLAPGGRAVIISFESLEDRLVKRAFQGGAREGAWRLMTEKPVVPTDEEIAANPRVRSAKLRAIERR